VNQFLKSPVREIRTPGSVGVGPPNWVALLPGGRRLKAAPYPDCKEKLTDERI